mmetsp:Transcript_12802/g.28830  ORF Transcript_12802/g.28830 Transcript_12802/m.28830 type:complete len:235 (-) Transcript_12802:198-902(-)
MSNRVKINIGTALRGLTILSIIIVIGIPTVHSTATNSNCAAENNNNNNITNTINTMTNSSNFSINDDNIPTATGQPVQQPPSVVSVPSSSGSGHQQYQTPEKTVTRTSITYTIPASDTNNQQQQKVIPSAYNNDELLEMKLRRKRRTIIWGVVGGVVGVVFLGPIGGIAGGLAGSLGTRANGKRREKKKRNEIIQRNSGSLPGNCSNGSSNSVVVPAAPVEEDVVVPAYRATAV